MNRILMIIVTVMTICIAVLSMRLRSATDENIRLARNQESLLTSVDHSNSKSGKSVASVGKVTLKHNELISSKKDLLAVAKDMDIKPKRIESASTTSSEISYKVVTVVRDSVVYSQIGVDTVKCVSYNDPWLNFNGTINNGLFNGEIESRDTMVQIIHRIPHKFLFFKFGTKSIRQTVLSKNPHNKIIYTEYLEFSD